MVLKGKKKKKSADVVPVSEESLPRMPQPILTWQEQRLSVQEEIAAMAFVRARAMSRASTRYGSGGKIGGSDKSLEEVGDFKMRRQSSMKRISSTRAATAERLPRREILKVGQK